ncbi:general stress protein CsbD [Flavobacterium alkalisoli]|uniref:General stress protein CsbD n=1 Tax=Flavobacterium alkalisoli TaxID=2602769 RepID=A0A5B9FSE4_9FLAO|nr:general stress protein CsbD [Flavobacterium alkalisoli]QEE49129.1 general stress protein CsbD [Flavobacterium alkalisoli]
MENSRENSQAVKTSWKEQKAKLKLKFPSLTDSDLHFEEGKKDIMLRRVETKLGKSKEEFSQILTSL